MPKYEELEPGKDGWEPWEKYTREFRIGCCDCGLVHDVQMKRVKQRTYMRWRRNERATAAMRRK